MAAKSGAVIVPWQIARQDDPKDRKSGVVQRAKSTAAPSLIWNGVEYPRVRPGSYQATCVSWQGPEFVWEFRRWSLRLEFCLLDDGTLVSTFINFGKEKRPEVQGQRSRFFKEWCMANGGPPVKGQELKFETFVDPELIYTIRVEDCAMNSKGAEKDEALVYSRVEEIVKVRRGSR